MIKINNGEEQFKPQFEMRRKGLNNLPEIKLPVGYQLRSFQSGDESQWEKIINVSFGEKHSFKKEIEAKEQFIPDRVFFISHQADGPIATAIAWHENRYGEKVGYLHMVAALPAHRGKGLGFQVSLATLYRMKKEKRESAVLQTDDFRIPAIITYLKLGFQPRIIHQNQSARWRDIFIQIDQPDLIDKYL